MELLKKTYYSSLVKLPTTRGLLKMIFLGLITLGIYPLVVYTKISNEINIVASRHDGKITMNYFLVCFIFSWMTLGICPIVWIHRICNRIGNELNRRGVAYNFGASCFWLWGVLGAFIIIGPYVFVHKFMKAMNKLNADFNQKG